MKIHIWKSEISMPTFADLAGYLNVLVADFSFLLRILIYRKVWLTWFGCINNIDSRSIISCRSMVQVGKYRGNQSENRH